MGLRTALRWAARQAELERRGISETVLTAGVGRDILWNSPDGWEVEQPALWWVPGDGPTAIGNPPPGGTPDGGTFGTLAAVQRCTSLICDVIAGLPWKIVRGEWEELPTPSWISDPEALRPDGRNPFAGGLAQAGLLPEDRLSAVEFWSTWIRSALWWGDGYVYVPVRDAYGQPVPPVWMLHPDRVSIRGGRYWAQGDDDPLPPGSIIHLRGGPVQSNGHGTGVLTEHAADLGLALNVRDYSVQQYQSGIPSGYIESTQPSMRAEQARALQDAWMSQHAGQRRVAVLNATTKFVPIAVSPLDAQLDSARQWALRDIAMVFGMPAYMLDIPGDSATYANVESRMIQYRMLTLLSPWARRIESTIDARFPAGTSLKIRTAGLERADTTTRYAAYKTGLDAGFLTVDEVRALEDLPPLDIAVAPAPSVPVPPEPVPPLEEAAQNG